MSAPSIATAPGASTRRVPSTVTTVALVMTRATWRFAAVCAAADGGAPAVPSVSRTVTAVTICRRNTPSSYSVLPAPSARVAAALDARRYSAGPGRAGWRRAGLRPGLAREQWSRMPCGLTRRRPPHRPRPAAVAPRQGDAVRYVPPAGPAPEPRAHARSHPRSGDPDHHRRDAARPGERHPGRDRGRRGARPAGRPRHAGRRPRAAAAGARSATSGCSGTRRPRWPRSTTPSSRSAWPARAC